MIEEITITFCLFVRKALEEVLAFEEAIRAAAQIVNLKETLIIVTADHSHSFHLVGEPSRFQNVLDLDEKVSKKVMFFLMNQIY